MIKLSAGVVLLSGLLAGCTSNDAYAPVVNAWQQPQAAEGFYVVCPGDTLYSIAWSFGLDYRMLAKANHLQPPYTIDPGDKLRMSTHGIAKSTIPQPVVATAKVAPTQTYHKPIRRVAKPIKKQVKKTVSRPSWAHTTRVSHWVWPAKGRVVGKYSRAIGGNQGIDIAGRYGERINAAAAGQVVYSGSGVRGYGNLIIIKHTNSYLSAYAFNKRNLVKDGTWVRRGQEIATMGKNLAGRVLLHFEIRKNGKPVNPLNYLR